MWTPTIQQIEKGGQGTRIVVQFSNDVSPNLSFSREFLITFPNPDMAWLQRQVQYQIQTIDSINTFADSLTLGSVISLPVSATPTQAQIDQNTFVQDYATLLKMRTAIQQGLKTSADSDFVTLLAKVKAEFQPGYINLL